MMNWLYFLAILLTLIVLSYLVKNIPQPFDPVSNRGCYTSLRAGGEGCPEDYYCQSNVTGGVIIDQPRPGHCVKK
jgi:hypothetical protein